MPKVQSAPKPETAPPAPAAVNGKANGKSKSKAEPKREVIYPKISVKIFVGNDAMNCEQAKAYLGWQEVNKGEFHLTDRNEKKVRLLHNPSNRKFKPQVALMYMQLILSGQWELNLEAMIFGQTGLVISAQHRLAAFIMACQEWHKTPDEYPFWKAEPTLQCICNFGCDESDRVVNTIDTGEPRSFADAVYRSPYFANMDSATRDKCSRMTHYAVQWIEHRTDARKDALSPKRPHAEGLEFLDRHSRILKAVKHVKEEDAGEGKIAKYLSPGYAAAMMYLMAVGTTDPKKYRSADKRTEKLLDFANWEEAENFIVNLAGGEKKMLPVNQALQTILNAAGRITRDEGCALLAKAWLCVVGKKPVNIELDFKFDNDGTKYLAECPSVGGIDLGSPGDESDESADDPTPEQIEQRATAVRNGKSKKKGPPAKEGDTVYVEEDGGHFNGKVTEIYDTPNGKVAKILMGNKKSTEAALSDCLTTDPNA